jgi:mono/diheme cytochrome c family protein
MSARKLVWAATAVFAVSLLAGAQEQKPEKVIKHVPMKSTSPTSGHDMYVAYCAACHGTDGKGAGPAAEALKVPPTDLTVLSKNHGGEFPSDRVISVIRGEDELAAHGTREMPIWGQLFWTTSRGNQAEVHLRVRNLTEYIKSLQAR